MFCFVLRIAAILLLVVAGTVAPAAAEDRPFSASGAGRVESYYSSLYGPTGIKATHLGRSILGVDYFPDHLQDGWFIPFNGYLKSASGDDLNFIFDAHVYFFDPATGVVSTTVTFTGGAGRFQDATGSAVVMFDFTPDFYHFNFLIDGSIDY